uniref:Uncharacterized protein n=1 Tax=Sphaerodactylus townsendi TaxID=933632 RepID=A0ACB8FKZ3_9SAUR
MWNSSSAQDGGPALDWSSYAKRLPPKGTVKNGNKQDETWIPNKPTCKASWPISATPKKSLPTSYREVVQEETTHSNKMDYTTRGGLAGQADGDGEAQPDCWRLQPGGGERPGLPPSDFQRVFHGFRESLALTGMAFL